MKHEELEGYVVTELNVGQMMPIIEMASSEDPVIRRDFQRKIAEAALRTPTGDAVDVNSVPFTTYMKLLPVILRVNGIAGAEDVAGKE